MATKLSIALIVLAACGDDGGSTTRDASTTRDSLLLIDALQSGCDYVEQRDTTNDDVPPATGTPEATNLTFGSPLVLCGTFDHTHFGDDGYTVDVDGYIVTVATDTDVLVRLNGAGAEAMELVAVDVYTGPNFSTKVPGELTFYNDHGVASVHLAPGTYEFLTYALNSAAITASVPYKLEIIPDSPAVRCPELTSGGYAEANDGGSNNGNDMIAIATNLTTSFTAGADTPEPTGLTLSSSSDQRLTGTAANIAAPDKYEDKDTFAFATSAMTNELTVRLTWAGTNTNLDYYLFEADKKDPVLRATLIAKQSPEVQTFSIKPSTSYWLLIGAHVGATAFPAYSASLCPAKFVP